MVWNIRGAKLFYLLTLDNAKHGRYRVTVCYYFQVIKMLAVVVALFGVCWLPLHVFVLLMDFKPDLFPVSKESDVTILISAYYTVHWLAMSNSFVNPIIYSFLNETFRVGQDDIITRVWQVRYIGLQPAFNTGINCVLRLGVYIYIYIYI